MPTFPTYHGELPKCLNPLKPHHWWLLLYWIFFRPTALKCYLYQADPERYRSKMGLNIVSTWNVPAYRHLYVMMLGVSMLFSVLSGFPFTLLLGWNKAIPIDWWLWIAGTAIGIVIGVGFCVGFGIILCVRSDLAAGVALSATLGMFGGIATSVWMGATAGVVFNVGFKGVFNSPFAVTIGLVFGVGAVFITGMALTSTFDWRVGVPVGVVCGIVTGVGIGGVLGIGSAIGVKLGFGVAFGLLGGIIGNLFIGIALCAVASIRGNFVLGIVSSLMWGVISGLVVDAATGLSLCIGILRLVFYPFQLVLALCSGAWRIQHPIEWDDLIMFPLPGTRNALARKLQQNERKGERKGLYVLANVGCNPFQRSAMQTVLYDHLHEHVDDPIHFFYTLLTDPDFAEYVITPTKPENWQQNIPIYQLFLGELALQFVLARQGIYASFVERIIWWISYPLREHRRSPLTQFAGMLYALLDKDVIKAEAFTLSAYAEIYNNLSEYAGGAEIAHTFDAMAMFLTYNNLSHLSNVPEITSNFPFNNPIRPTVLTAFNRLGQVGAEIKTYQDSTSKMNQQGALLRAADALQDLDAYVREEVMLPEQYLLRKIITQWRTLITDVGGEVGRAEVVGPVANPYVAGNPVSGGLFVGREDILGRLEELWSGAGQKPSIILYGHRRMGKSSILQNLGKRFGTDILIVDFNMQREGIVASTGELFYNLAVVIYDELKKNSRNFSESERLNLSEPEEEQFTSHNPYTAFNRFLKQLDQARENHRFIVTVDEFELIEDLIAKGIIEVRLLDFCRGLIQTYPWFIMAFAGLHTLEEMTHDYWHPFFGSIARIPVSFLTPGAARKLITQPSPDFPIDYDQDAIDTIIGLTNGQPYLVQLIGHGLVSRFNRQRFEEGIERERRFSLEDVEAVISAPEFFRDGHAYFTGVWVQADTTQPPGQTQVLIVLAPAATGLTLEELAQHTGLSHDALNAALDALCKHDVVRRDGETWQFTVELMRRWVKQQA